MAEGESDGYGSATTDRQQLVEEQRVAAQHDRKEHVQERRDARLTQWERADYGDVGGMCISYERVAS